MENRYPVQHKARYGAVWKWAGKYRTPERNMGVDPSGIPISVRDLVDDAAGWIAPDNTGLDRDHAVCRVHHGLVAIHPFPNGNGWHARTFADLLMRALDGQPLTRGATNMQGDGPNCQQYRDALRAADEAGSVEVRDRRT